MLFERRKLLKFLKKENKMLQQKLDQLKKEIESKNTDNSTKFDLLWNLPEIIEKTPKVKISKNLNFNFYLKKFI